MTSLIQLRILLGREDQPHAARPTHGDLALKVAAVCFRSVFAPALLHLQNLVGCKESQFSLERCLQVRFEEADLVALAAEIVHVDAMGRWLSFVRHRVHEPGHDGIVGRSPVEALYA